MYAAEFLEHQKEFYVAREPGGDKPELRIPLVAHSILKPASIGYV